jgi:hypothetical protein
MGGDIRDFYKQERTCCLSIQLFTAGMVSSPLPYHLVLVYYMTHFQSHYMMISRAPLIINHLPTTDDHPLLQHISSPFLRMHFLLWPQKYVFQLDSFNCKCKCKAKTSDN